jgi:hypothetical protein
MSYQPLFLGLGTAVTSTDSNNNRLRGETTNLRQGQPVRFVIEGNNMLFGGVVANTLYYIKDIIDSEFFTVSTTLNGDVLELLDGEGFMLVRTVQKELTSESLRKADSMFREIYTSGFSEDNVGILSVEEDDSPSLGGNLNLNSNEISGTGAINITGNINATVVSGDLRGIVAGGLRGPVDENGVRIGLPTIDGLPFELGSPQANQIIAWSVSEEKFVMTSLQAASGTDTLDDVLFRGNTSSVYGINVNGVTTTSLTVSDGIDYADLINTPSIPADISDLTDATNIIPVDVSDLTDTTNIIPADISDLTDTTNIIPADISDLTDTTNIIPTQLTDLGITDGTPGQVLTTNGSGGFTFTTVSGGGGGGTGLGSRTTVGGTTGALAINGVGNLSITGFKTYALLGIYVEIPAWVRLYSSAAARTADASRLENQDPQPGAGIIAEVITTSNDQTVLFTPATIGFNAESPVSTTIYASVKNKGTGVATIEIAMSVIQLEA